MKFTGTLVSTAALALVVGLLTAGCATQGYKKADQTGINLQNFRKDIVEFKQALDASLALAAAKGLEAPGEERLELAGLQGVDQRAQVSRVQVGHGPCGLALPALVGRHLHLDLADIQAIVDGEEGALRGVGDDLGVCRKPSLLGHGIPLKPLPRAVRGAAQAAGRVVVVPHSAAAGPMACACTLPYGSSSRVGRGGVRHRRKDGDVPAPPAVLTLVATGVGKSDHLLFTVGTDASSPHKREPIVTNPAMSVQCSQSVKWPGISKHQRAMCERCG